MPKSVLMPVDVDMTEMQKKKLHKGKTITLKAEQLHGSGVRIHVASSKAKKMTRAKKNNKGFRLTMNQEEMETTGGALSLKAIGRAIKKGAKQVAATYKKDIKPVVAPVLKEGVKQAITKGLPLAASAAATALGQPQLAVPAAVVASKIAEKIAEPAASKLGQVSGAYGVKSRKLQSNYSNFLNHQHPAMNPALPMHDNSIAIVGGSFRAIGSSRGGALLGTPMMPRMPQGDNSMIRINK